MNVREVKKNTPQYRDFVDHRLPAMRRKGLDGLTVKLSDRRGPTCCFNSESRFRTDLEEHIMPDHLNNFNIELFQSLTIYYCNMCRTKTRITCTKSTSRSYYQIIRRCGCKPKRPHRFAKPWSELTFSDLYNELLQYNHSLKGKFLVQNSTSRVDDTKSTCQSMATQTESINESEKDLFDSQCAECYATRSMISSDFDRLTDHVQNRSDVDIAHKTSLNSIIGRESYLPSENLVADKIEVFADSVQDNKKSRKRVSGHHRTRKSC